MTSDDRFERLLVDVLVDVAPTREPDRLVPEILRAARRERRWPRWLALIKEPPMRIHAQVAVGSPIARLGVLLVLTLLMMVAAAGAVVTGASLLPADVQPPPVPTAFSATYIGSGQSTSGSTTEFDDGTTMSVGVGWMWGSRESSDPRFAGPLVWTNTEIRYPDLGGSIGVGGYRIETDEGAWQQVPTAGVGWDKDAAKFASGDLPPADNIQYWTFIGEGAYEGLTAVVQETWRPGGADRLIQFDGFIFAGELWDAPESWVP